jgi:diguanylate cyclase (GGDEF)-like protein
MNKIDFCSAGRSPLICPLIGPIMKKNARPVRPHSGIPRRTIGYMTNGIISGGGKGGYHYALWKGIQETARAHDMNLVSFIGGSYRISPSYQYEYQRNNVFEMISSDHLDGLIISSAALIPTINIEELQRYSALFPTRAVVSIGLQLDAVPSLFVENRSGARKLVDHLIKVHGFRNIAYICGPEVNEDAEVRYQAYLDSLRAHGLPIDPDLIFQGDFTRLSGEAIATRFLTELHKPVDAIVAANDNMALGIISVLRSHGIAVPDDLAVVGYDDIPDANLSYPPLTTVRQPTYELGKRAAELLIAHLAGQAITPCETLSADVVVRSTCGCAMPLIPDIPAGPSQISAALLPADARQRRVLVRKMVDSLGCNRSQRKLASQHAAQLLDAIFQVVYTPTPRDTDLKYLAMQMNLVMENGPLLPWHRAISGLIRSQWTEENAAGWRRVWELSGEMTWFSQSFVRLQEQDRDEKQSELFRGISQALVTTFNVSDLMETIWRLLPRLGISGCWVYLYDPPSTTAGDLRLKLAYNREGRVELPEEGLLLPGHFYLPKETLPRGRPLEAFVNSLYYNDVNFGYVVFEMDEPDQKILDMITSQISTALQGTRVVNELQFMEAEFRRQATTDPLTGIYNRRMLYNLGEPAFKLAHHLLTPLSVAMIDVDNFKRVNDQFGHATGDRVLSTLSRIVRSQIRGSDIFGRFGGEEFVVILPETPIEMAAQIAERVRHAIESHVFTAGKVSVQLTISLGLAELSHHEDHTIDALLDKADKALYEAKRAGKNRVALYTIHPLSLTEP